MLIKILGFEQFISRISPDLMEFSFLGIMLIVVRSIKLKH